jgi:hypothetical protein
MPTYVGLQKVGPYTLGPKASWYYWFYYEPHFNPYNYVMEDKRILYLTPRPRTEVPDWSIQLIQTRLVLERQGDGYRYSYRALVDNPTNAYVQFDFVISSVFGVGTS